MDDLDTLCGWFLVLGYEVFVRDTETPLHVSVRIPDEEPFKVMPQVKLSKLVLGSLVGVTGNK